MNGRWDLTSRFYLRRYRWYSKKKDSPPFRPLTEEEDKNIIENINKIKPDFVWIGLGAPKQEKWMAEHQGKIDAQYFCEFICNNISNFAIVKCFEIPVVNIFQTWYNVVISINGGR